MTEIKVPDIGDFRDVLVVEVPVKPGQRIEVDEPILMLESDKATLDVPSPLAGHVTEVLVTAGDRVSRGDPILRIDTPAQSAIPVPTSAATTNTAEADHTSLLVIGGGPGGYTAAFRAADLGRDVTLVDMRATLGGVCLNEGCIPSKALLHLAKIRTDAIEAAIHGLTFTEARIDLARVRDFKDGVVNQLTGGLAALARRRKVRIIQGSARFMSPHAVEITSDAGPARLTFDQAIIATGSLPARLPFLPDDPRIVDSTGTLALAHVPERLLVIGGGIIGLEMTQIYAALGSQIDIVEMATQIVPGADADIIAPLAKRLSAQVSAIRTGARVTAVEAGASLHVTIEDAHGMHQAEFDQILVAVGRRPNSAPVACEAAGITPDEAGFITTDRQMRTTQPHIFAIGDVAGIPMLAHKAVHEGKVAAEAACGEKSAFEPAGIPSVCYTDPEIAWVGLTGMQAKERGLRVRTGTFPWAASGRALSLGRDDGLTKLIVDAESGKLLGGAATGPGAGDIVAEIALALEMGADAEDLALTVHPHPTLSETVAFAAEAITGTLTDL